MTPQFLSAAFIVVGCVYVALMVLIAIVSLKTGISPFGWVARPPDQPASAPRPPRFD